MDTFLTILGWILFIFGGLFFLYCLTGVVIAPGRYASFATEHQRAWFRKSILGLMIGMVIFGSILGLGLWLALFR